LLADFTAGLAWLRAHAGDAVVFADDSSLLLSAVGEVRLFYENSVFTARGMGAGEPGEPFPERVALQQRVLRQPDTTAVAEARRAVGRGPRLLVVADFVPSRIESGLVLAEVRPLPSRPLLPEELFARRFANRAMHVYEAREEGPPR
jgi:hypothetical protein